MIRAQPIVVDSKDHGKQPAWLATCTCGSTGFCIFTVQGQDHAHYQCLVCDESYCSIEGACHVEDANGLPPEKTV